MYNKQHFPPYYSLISKRYAYKKTSQKINQTNGYNAKHKSKLKKVYSTFAISLMLIVLLIYSKAYAVREPRPIATDSRIRVLVYSPDDVFKFTGYYGYQASIELAKDEEVVSISMGDTTSWQIIPAGHRIFIKPVDQDATTNMTMITNKRTYFFELYAEEVSDIRDPQMIFTVRFIYPDDNETRHFNANTNLPSQVPDLNHPEKLNFHYSISGPDSVAPTKIFDDGDFTYMQFRDKYVDLPAFFAVDKQLRESMVDYRLSKTHKNMVIIEHVFERLTIRLGNQVLCVYNEAYGGNMRIKNSAFYRRKPKY